MIISKQLSDDFSHGTQSKLTNMRPVNKVVIAGEIWSPNLGDGIIADSLQFLLKRLKSDIEVHFLDISGRDALSLSRPVKIPPIKRMVRSKKLMRVILNARRWRILQHRSKNEWTSTFATADIVLIGGGQLLMDNDLDFPFKINTVARLAQSLGKSTHVVSCGVGKEWSFLAARLFRKALTHSSSITVRDTCSVQRLEQFVPGSKVSLSADPALWTSTIYEQNHKLDGNLVGLGIINVDLLNRYRNFHISLTDLVEFWLAVVSRLHCNGVQVELFSNGSPDDYEVAQYILKAIKDRLALPCTLAKRPTSARELALGISHYQAVIASRLHAHVIATSYLIPSVALVWDDKVRTFFRDTGRENMAFDGFDLNMADTVADKLGDIMGEQLSRQMLSEKQMLVLENLQRIVAQELV